MNESKQHYLSMHKYKIFQDKDGRWKTALPDESKKNGRRLVAKVSEKSLKDTIVKYYEKQEIEEKKLLEHPERNIAKLSPDITLEDVYPIWLKSRMLEAKNLRTVKRNNQEWIRYYKDSEIVKIPMRLLTVNELKDWAHKMIDENDFNKRDYYDMTLIIKKRFEYVSDDKICENTWEIAKTKVNTKKLKKIIKNKNDTQIYFIDEKMKLIKYSLKMFAERPWNIGVLTIPFLFVTGLRISEIVALKYSDIEDNEIIIRHAEVNDYEYDNVNNKFVYKGKKVEEHAKSEAGERSVPYTDGAKQIISMVKEASEYYGYYNNGYIFCPVSKRMTSNTIDKRIYAYCDAIDIPKKSAHKNQKDIH